MKHIEVNNYSALSKEIIKAKRNGYTVQREISGKYYLMMKDHAESIQIIKRKPEDK